MRRPELYSSLSDLFHGTLKLLKAEGEWTDSITDPTSVGSGFGKRPRRTKELLAVSLGLSNPQSRLLLVKSRKADLSFSVANTLWTLSGSSLVDPIAFYNERGRSFSTDKTHFLGAVGARLRKSPSGDQLLTVIQLLKENPATRRGIIHIHTPQDLLTAPPDTPCSLSLQYLVRSGRLNAITFMRSQSAAMILPYDVFLFTYIQEIIAAELDLGLGEYYHVCGSLHYYEDEEHLVTATLNDRHKERTEILLPPLPARPLGDLPKVLEAEEDLRNRLMAGEAIPPSVFERFPQDDHWQVILSLATARYRLQRGEPLGEVLGSENLAKYRRFFDEAENA